MKRTTKPLVPEEELDLAAAELLQLARDRGAEARRLPGRRVFTSHEDKPDIANLLTAELRHALEDEFIPAAATREGELDASEVERELLKKALVGLKLTNLRGVARARGVAVSGAAEELAERVARAYEWSSPEVAKLILRNEEEPSAERGHVSRVFALQSIADVAAASRRIAVMGGRYVRVGVAKWFVFSDVDRFEGASVNPGERLVVEGSYRAYRAAVDDFDGTPALQAVPESFAARVVVDEAKSIVVHAVNASAAKAASRALELATDLKLLGFVPHVGRMSRIDSSQINATSELLLDVLYNRLADMGFTDRDLTVARFKVSEASEDEIGDTRPALKAVRFEGRHLLDSVDACRLLANSRRPLVEVALHTSLEVDGVVARAPVKIAIDGEAMTVATGLGSRPELSSTLHAKVVEAVRAEVEDGVSDVGQLSALVAKIRARAASGVAPAAASMLSDADES